MSLKEKRKQHKEDVEDLLINFGKSYYYEEEDVDLAFQLIEEKNEELKSLLNWNKKRIEVLEKSRDFLIKKQLKDVEELKKEIRLLPKCPDCHADDIWKCIKWIPLRDLIEKRFGK